MSKLQWTGAHKIKGVLAALMLLSAVAAAAQPEDERSVEFSIPAQRADRALRTFARQAGLSVLFPIDRVSGVTTNPLIGTYAIDEGLALLLEGTGLEGGIGDGDRLTIGADAGDEPARTTVDDERLLTRAFASVVALLRGDVAAGDMIDATPTSALPEEIIVTGSRIHRGEYRSAQPTTVLDGSLFVQLGIANAGDAMALVPANLGNWNPTAKPGGNESVPLNVFNGLNLANLRGLNPRYGSRTLTLVNSRRHMPTNQGDGVDLNLIPAILIERMEVVTGGASASYGSGAIGGVVNLLLDNDLDGAKSEIAFGRTGQGDGNDHYYGFAWGGGIGEAGHLTLGLEFQSMDPVEDCIERSWCARGASVRENRLHRQNGAPNFIYREGARLDMSTRGVFVAQGRELDAGGTRLLPYRASGPYQVGGDGQHVYLDTTLRTNVEREIAYARYHRWLNDDFSFSIESSFGTVDSWTPQDSIDLFGAQLKADNFFLNRLAENPCAATPDACFLNKDFSAQVASSNETRTRLGRFTFGVGNRFGATSWTWDAWYQFGRSDMLQAVHDSRHARRMMFALDAVDDGSGRAMCRVTRDGIGNFDGDPRLADGCVPLNLFGTGAIPQDAFDYAWGRILEDTRVEQDMFEFVSSGELADGFGAGPVRAALGFSWRDERLRNVADMAQPDYVRTDYNSQFGETFGGDVGVVEYFAELELPLTQSLGAQLATRRSRYTNTAGIGTPVEGQRFRYDIDSWKANAHWDPAQWLTLRASRSHDLRAPNFRELYYGKVFPKGDIFGYCDNPWSGNRFEGWYTFTGDPCRAELHGGIDLKPESAMTTTYGFVVALPAWNARLSADYFDIEIADAITPASWSDTIDRCHRTRDAEFCSLIQGELLDAGDPLGGFARIDVVSSKALNQRVYETRGIDIAADWSHTYAAGTLTLHLMATHMISQLVQPEPNSPLLRNIAGMTGSPYGGFDWEAGPDWSGQLLASFVRGAFTTTLQGHYVSAGIKDAARIGPETPGYATTLAGSIDDNHVPSYTVWALNGAYAFRLFGAKAEFFGGIQNLFDRDPPLIGTGIGGTNAVLFDTLGRRYRVGLRTQF